MKNQKVQFITTLIVCVLVSSLVSVAATGNLFDSNEVVYDNTSSGMNATNVKTAVDELYAAANNYSDISNRVTTLENSLNSKFSSDNLYLRQPSTSTATNGTGLYMSYHGDARGWFYANNNGLVISSDFPNAAGTGAFGLSAGSIEIGRTNISTVNLKGDIKFNGTSVHAPSTYSVDSTIDLTQNSWKFKHIINISIPAGKHLYGANVRITDTIVAGAACIADTFGEGQIFVGCYSTATKSSVPITVDYLIY